MLCSLFLFSLLSVSLATATVKDFDPRHIPAITYGSYTHTLEKGNGAIEGYLRAKTQTFTEVTYPGEDVLLVPNSPFSLWYIKDIAYMMESPDAKDAISNYPTDLVKYTRTVKTDDHGYFRFTGVPDGHYYVFAYLEHEVDSHPTRERTQLAMGADGNMVSIPTFRKGLKIRTDNVVIASDAVIDSTDGYPAYKIDSFATPDGSTGQHYAASPTGLMSEGFNLTWPMMIYAIVFAAIPNFFSGFFFSFGITNMQVPVIFIQMFGATLTIGAYVFLGGTLLITIVEAYLVSVFGLLMAGLSPLRTTHAFGTQKAIGYAISVGVKLLTLYLVIGLIQTVIAPIIAAAAAIPIAGALTVGFYGVILALIAYNVPTFAASIVSGIASGNASAGVSAMTAAAGSATAMAQSMHGISEGIHNRNEAKQMGSDVQDRQSRSEHVTGGGKSEHVGANNKPVGTELSKDSLHTGGQGGSQGTSTATSLAPSMPQNVNANGSSPNASNQGIHNADSSNGAKPEATQHHGVRGLLDKAGSEAKQLASEMKSGEQGSAAAGSASAGQGNGSTQNGGQSDSKQTKSAYEKFKEVNDDPNATTDQKNAAANTFWSAQSKELSDAKQEMMSSFDGLGKGFAGMLTPSGGASSGAVAGATLKSSV